jgi:ABC-type multidrug transport system fused ATPase/permease subunit
VLRTPYRYLLRTYVLPHWPSAVLLSLLLGSLIGLDLLQPQIVRYFLDTAQAGGAMGRLVAAALLYLGAAVLGQVVGVAEGYTAANLGWRATNALRADLTQHCLGLDLAFHNSRTPGELIERLDGDISVLANFFSRFVLQVAGNGLLLLGVLVLVYREDRRIGLMLLGFSVVALLVMNGFRNPGARSAVAGRRAMADLFGFLEERLNGLPDIQTAGAQAYVLHGLSQRLQGTIQTGRATFFLGSFMGGATSLVFTAATAAALALSASFFRAGSMSIGTVYLIFQYTTMVRAPLGHMTRQVRDFQRAAAGVARVRQLAGLAPTIADGPGALLPAGALGVEFRHVSFAYPALENGGPPADILTDITFRLAPGQVLGVLGRTGSGKTTLARLLCRLYDPGAGAVLLGGVDVRRLKLAEIGRQVGMVTQEVQLFPASVRENLTLFDPAIADGRILAALEGLGLMEWYGALPAGLDTVLTPGGGLSAGEAQLLAFARVFLRDPAVVILDEASSRLDPATETRLERAVERLLRPEDAAERTRRTAIVIAHRLSTVAKADEILVLEDGRVVEYGERRALAGDAGSRFAALLRSSERERVGELV